MGPMGRASGLGSRVLGGGGGFMRRLSGASRVYQGLLGFCKGLKT